MNPHSVSRNHMKRDDYPVTPETIRLALEEQAREREKAKRECGIDFDGDRVVIRKTREDAQ